MTSKLRFLFRKGTIDVILYLGKVKKAGYYELYKQGFVVSRQSFANLLRTLEQRNVVGRHVIDSRPPKVEYSLTEKGKEVAELLTGLEKVID